MDPWSALGGQVPPFNVIRSKSLRLITAISFLVALWLFGKPLYDQSKMDSALKLAEMGSPDGMVVLGHHFETGDVVKQDHAQAMDWYLKGANRGSGAAMLDISNLYERGLGVPKDDVAAYAWAILGTRHSSELAEGTRSRLAKSLSPDQIRQGEQQADQWRPANQ